MSDEPRPDFEPHVSPNASPLEATLRTFLMGIVFGIVFGAANAYLGLQAGLTISTSIPIAVMTVAAFRAFARAGRKPTLLEANLAQTTGSASSSLASGIIFTLPALWMWNAPPELLQMTLLAAAGGTIGILFMIPLRSYLIAHQHGKLPYPEGTACAEVLKASEKGGDSARAVFFGLGTGALFKGIFGGLKLLPSSVSLKLPLLPNAVLGAKLSSALMGVGFILGPRIASIMVAGGLLASLVLIPGITMLFGDTQLEVLEQGTLVRIAARDATASQIWDRMIRYIGAGAVAAAGLITLVRSIPTMVRSFRASLGHFGEDAGEHGQPRTERDLPIKFVLVGLAAIAIGLAISPAFEVLGSLAAQAVAACLVIVAAFFFVTVSSRIVGLVGVTSNPTSGMTIATLLLTSTVFLLLGWSGLEGKIAAITVGCVVAIAASIAGDTSQDLKTGFLLGATPWRQQVGELLGVVTAAAFVALAVRALGEGYGFGSAELPAPQATLMKLVIDGVLDQSLPWHLVALGAALAVGAELLRLPSLAFAVGVYLPLSTMMTVFLGGGIRWLLNRRQEEKESKARTDRGTLYGSGLVGGEGLIGVIIALVVLVAPSATKGFPWWKGQGPWASLLSETLAALLLAGLAFAIARAAQGRWRLWGSRPS